MSEPNDYPLGELELSVRSFEAFTGGGLRKEVVLLSDVYELLASNREQKAEIERLKVELAKTGTGDYKADFYLGRKTLSGYLRDAEDDRDGWKRLYDAEKAECASLRASAGEKWIGVVREYRTNQIYGRHGLCRVRVAGWMHGTKVDDRCPICVQADELLAPPTLPTEKEK
jgi:hypothetical protein